MGVPGLFFLVGEKAQQLGAFVVRDGSAIRATAESIDEPTRARECIIALRARRERVDSRDGAGRQRLGGREGSFDEIQRDGGDGIVFEAADGFIGRKRICRTARIAEQITDGVVVFLVGQSSQRNGRSAHDGRRGRLHGVRMSSRSVRAMRRERLGGRGGAAAEENKGGKKWRQRGKTCGEHHYVGIRFGIVDGRVCAGQKNGAVFRNRPPSLRTYERFRGRRKANRRAEWLAFAWTTVPIVRYTPRRIRYAAGINGGTEHSGGAFWLHA